MPVGAIIGSSVIGAGVSAWGASQAANAQEKAAQQATAAQLKMFEESKGLLSPYASAGQTALSNYMDALPGLTRPFQPTMAELSKTPGYQFTLDQGLKATQNSYAAQGLGTSGAAMKGAAGYAEGLASQTYQQQFLDYLQQNQQRGQLMFAPAQLGEQAAGSLAGAATQTGALIGGNIIGAGNARAGADIGIANAFGGGLNNIASYYMMQNLLNSGGGGAAGAQGSMLGSMLSWSDKREKKRIEKIGEFDDGMPIYLFQYRREGAKAPWRIGVMAQDVRKKFPGAVQELLTPEGKKRLAVDFGEFGRLLRKAA